MIRPIDLPDLRAEALLWQAANGDRMLRQWNAALQARGENDPGLARSLWQREIQTLGSADLYFVTAGMGRLAQAAASDLPTFPIEPADLPSRAGFVVFADGIDTSDAPGYPVARVHAVLWQHLPINAGDSFMVTPYVHRTVLLDAFGDSADTAPAGSMPGLFGAPGFAYTVPPGHSDWGGADQVLQTVMSTLLLMRQPLAEESVIETDRATRKRLQRAGQEPKPIRVIDIRRRERGGSAADGSHEYHHQWIVRGHWRQQWYPAREVHRPVWIAPHIKGPDGAPLLGGEKVYAVRTTREEAGRG